MAAPKAASEPVETPPVFYPQIQAILAAAGGSEPITKAAEVYGIPPIDGSLYAVTMLRHDASPSIVLPTSPPVGIPFPFDIGFDDRSPGDAP